MNFSRSITLVVGLAALGSAYAGWNRLPFIDARPVDLAASAIPGTKVISSIGLDNAGSLIASNINETVTLAAGRSSAVIQLTSQQNVHTIVFNNDGAEGKITIGGSVDNRDWSGLGSAVFSAGDRVAQVHFATATVKYLSVNFESAKGGAIRAFEVFGTSTDRDYKLTAKETGSPVNLATVVGGARPIFAFPTPTGVGELSYLHNVFQFPKSTDKFRTIVYDLGASRTVDQFATTHSLRPVRVEVFAFDQLPEKEDWRGKLTLDPAIFNATQPVAVGEDSKGVGRVTMTPAKPVAAHYIALRFEPNYQLNDAVAASNIGTRNLIVSAAGPFGSVLGGLSLLPEFRFTKSQGAGNDDLMVGSIEFHSNSGFEVAPNVSENTLAYEPPALPKKSKDVVAVYSSAAIPAPAPPPAFQVGASVMPLKSGAATAPAASNPAASKPVVVASVSANMAAAVSAPDVSSQSGGSTTQLLQTFSSVTASDSNADKNKEIDAIYNAAVKAAAAEKKAAQDAAKAAKDAVFHTPGVTQAQKDAAQAQYDADNKAADDTYKMEKAAAEAAKKEAHDHGDQGDHGDHGDHGPPHTT